MNRNYLQSATVLIVSLIIATPTAIAQQQGHGAMQRSGAQQGMMGRGMHGSMMQRGMMGGDCPMMGMKMGRRANTFAKGRIAFLRAELGITDAQKTAFDAYAAALKDNLESMRGMRQAMRGAMASKTPVERLDAHLGMMENRLAVLKEVKPKLEALYAALGDGQKKKANTLLTGMGCMM